MALSNQERADKSAAAMWENDNASKFIGMVIDAVSEGRATLSMQIETHHTNGHGICHGGYIFTLADSAFAFACNSRNQNTVAQNCTISFLAPGRLGDRLTATAEEIHLAGRSGIYDVSIVNQDKIKIAEFRGLSRSIKGQLFEEAP